MNNDTSHAARAKLRASLQNDSRLNINIYPERREKTSLTSNLIPRTFRVYPIHLHTIMPFHKIIVVAIIPLVLFFGTGILTKEDFNNFLWTIIILAAGGLSLGKVVSSSGLAS